MPVCMWIHMITIFTVGYGDYYPKSHIGRFIMVVTAFQGVLLLSLVVVTLNNNLEFTNYEKKAF